MAVEQVQLKFRVPAELRNQLEAAAELSGRSVSAEITARLEASFEGAGLLTHQEMNDAIIEHEKRMDALETAIERIHDLTGTQPWNER